MTVRTLHAGMVSLDTSGIRVASLSARLPLKPGPLEGRIVARHEPGRRRSREVRATEVSYQNRIISYGGASRDSRMMQVVTFLKVLIAVNFLLLAGIAWIVWSRCF